jgi:hypothetical protein
MLSAFGRSQGTGPCATTDDAGWNANEAGLYRPASWFAVRFRGYAAGEASGEAPAPAGISEQSET